MKIKDLFEAGYTQYGPGDWQTAPGAFRQAGLIPGAPRRARQEVDPEDRFADMDAEARAERARQAAFQAKISDEHYEVTKTTPPVTTYTAVAANEDIAKRRVGQLRYTAWRFDDAKIEPLPDGRFKVTVVYVQ